MPNNALVNKTFKVPENMVGTANGNTTLSYDHMRKMKSDLQGKMDSGTATEEENQLATWVGNSLETSIQADRRHREIRAAAGAPGAKRSVNGNNNNFKLGTHKDNDNANPTAVGGVVDAKSLGSNRNIMNNAADYTDAGSTKSESIKKEMESILYLIEYMNNNKKII